MKRIGWLVVWLGSLGIAPVIWADAIVSFEDQGVAPGTFANNAGPGGFWLASGQAFNNNFDVDPIFGPFWSGWAISATTDSMTPGFLNQYSAITGGGAAGSDTYGVAFTSTGIVDPFEPDGSFVDLAPGLDPVSIEITNTTYTYFSIRDGDSFTDPFSDGDFFRLTITGYDGADVIGSVVVFLSDYRDGKSEILDVWQEVDLSGLAGSTRLRFGLFSTMFDPMFGMSTPAYFAADQLRLRERGRVVPEPATWISCTIGFVVLGLARVRKASDRTRRG